MQFYEKPSKHINSDPKEQWLKDYKIRTLECVACLRTSHETLGKLLNLS